MRNLRGVLIFLFLLICIVGCNGTASHDDPDYMLKNNPNIDMIVYGLSAYINANDVEWVIELDLEKKDEIGVIQGVYTIDTELFLTATLIPEGAVVYKTTRDDIIIVEVDDVLIPYLEWIEG